jgi:hypothetical protein
VLCLVLDCAAADMRRPAYADSVALGNRAGDLQHRPDPSQQSGQIDLAWKGELTGGCHELLQVVRRVSSTVRLAIFDRVKRIGIRRALGAHLVVTRAQALAGLQQWLSEVAVNDGPGDAYAILRRSNCAPGLTTMRP